jgi:hypothetical protein
VLAAVDDVLVDLVGHREHVVRHAQVADGLELAAVKHAARRVAGGVDDDRPGARGEGRGQPGEVERPAGLERHVDRPRVGENRVGSVVFVERLEDDHLVARIHQREQRGDHRLGGAAGDGDLPLGIRLQPVPLRVGSGQHGA